MVPIDDSLVDLCKDASRVVTIEDGLLHGGFGSALAERLLSEGLSVPMQSFGIPKTFIDTGSRAQVLERFGLTAQDVSRHVVEWVSATWAAPTPAAQPDSASS